MQVVFQPAGHDQLDRLRRNALVVHVVCAQQALAVVTLQAGIIDDIKGIGQHARMIAGRKRPVGARLGAQLGTRRRHRVVQQRVNVSRAGVGTQQHRPVILLLHQRRVAQIGERGDQFNRMLVEGLRRIQFARARAPMEE